MQRSGALKEFAERPVTITIIRFYMFDVRARLQRVNSPQQKFQLPASFAQQQLYANRQQVPSFSTRNQRAGGRAGGGVRGSKVLCREE